MKFCVDYDTGNEISGWVTGDNPGESPTLEVFVPGRETVEIACNARRQDLVDLGWSTNSLVGFRITEALLDNLENEPELEIRDKTTGVTIFKRREAGSFVHRRVAILENREIPRREFFATAGESFNLVYDLNEVRSFDTLEWIIRYPHAKSLLLSGRTQFSRHAAAMREADFVFTALLRSPFEELAERLAFLKVMARSGGDAEASHVEEGFQLLSFFAGSLDFEDPRAMSRAFRRMPLEVKDLLRDPLTRMMSCGVNERPTRNHVSLALEALATMDIVGTTAKFPEFAAMLADSLGVNVFGNFVPPTWKIVSDLTDTLSRIGPVRDLLENDLALYSYIEEAVETGLG